MGNIYSQFFPPAPTLTDENLPSQANKVFIITGGYSGVGLALARILHNAGGKVYIAGRSRDKAAKAIDHIESQKQSGNGEFHFLELDLSDLRTIKPAVKSFLERESRLDVLFNNAGVSSCPVEIKTTQGLDMQMGTNAVGHYLLTTLLLPILRATAKLNPQGQTRVIWTSSIVVEAQSQIGGMDLAYLNEPSANPQLNYCNSKVANLFLCRCLARESTGASKNVVHAIVNPGNLATNLTRHLPKLLVWLVQPLLYNAKFGAYSALWAGLCGDVQQGDYVIPWGRRNTALRKDLVQACQSVEDGGQGTADKLRRWCDEKMKDFL